MIIHGRKTYLRAMEAADMPMYMEMANDPDIEWMIGGWSYPISSLDQEEWFQQAHDDRRNLRFTIVAKDADEAVGMTNLVNIDWKNRSAFTGIKLSPKAPKGVGIATDAVMALMQYAFEELGMVRLDTSWVEYNEPSLRLYQKCGWKIEGKKEKASFKRGAYHAVLFGGILADDYQMVKKTMGW